MITYRKAMVAAAALLLTFFAGALAGRASGAPLPDPTSLDALSKRYHCGDYFHDWTDWQRHVRGFILYKPGTNPVVYTHVAGRMSDYYRYDYLIVSLCAK